MMAIISSIAMPNENLYTPRINLVQNYMAEHVGDELKLDALARVAGFSPFHFHRIFKDLVGETVNDFVVRSRLERATSLMRASKQALTQIAFASGFQSSSDFSRVFKQWYGLPPSAWDRAKPLAESKIRKAESGLPQYTAEQLHELAQQHLVSVQPFPATRLAYVRVIDSYNDTAGIGRAMERVCAWAQREGVCGALIGMSQDDPDITPPAQCRYDVCMTLPEGAVIHRGDRAWLGERVLPACLLAQVHVMGDITRLDQALQVLLRWWLPRGGYLPDNLPAMEIYRQTPLVLGWETFDLDCCVPVVKM
jgi:AraC-like DNA-binding protein/DNA gyrase inhibitor GyrI